MNETQLRGWMRALPRAKASPTFTSDVLRKAGQSREERRTPLVWRFGAAFAMAACLVILVQGAIMFQAQRQEHVASLREERQQIAAELEDMKQMARESEPVLVLEDDQGTRVIMDLDSAIQPASLRTFD